MAMQFGSEVIGLAVLAALLGVLLLWVFTAPSHRRPPPPRKTRPAERQEWDPNIYSGRHGRR